MSLETARLALRPPHLSDAAPLFEFLGDSEAMRYTTVRKSVQDCRRYIAAHERQRRRIGCAPWVIIEKQTARIIGVGGIYEDPFDSGWGVEIGYFFAPAAWGRGFATELALYCVGWAKQQARWETLCAFAHPDNRASQQVLQKTGFRQERLVPEMNRILYRRELRGA
jgi:RimJ/RimL family protein N-acetyltransferase